MKVGVRTRSRNAVIYAADYAVENVENRCASKGEAMDEIIGATGPKPVLPL